jgi:hypothetical protein
MNEANKVNAILLGTLTVHHKTDGSTGHHTKLITIANNAHLFALLFTSSLRRQLSINGSA